jgi:NTP pyrophosphatase (non-canonical NTP hydrolase)
MSTKADKFHVVNSALGAAALLEQLAEESTELAHAALKQARIERDENPTPVSASEAFSNLFEEVADVRLCIRAIEATQAKKKQAVQRKKERHDTLIFFCPVS